MLLFVLATLGMFGCTSNVVFEKLNVDVHVKNRLVHSRVLAKFISSNDQEVNDQEDEFEEVVFKFQTPKNSVLSSYVMKIDEKEYKGIVYEKKEARQKYDGSTCDVASLLSVSPKKESLEYTFSTKIKPGQKVSFEFSYEELLLRKFGYYEFQLDLDSIDRSVKDFSVVVDIYDDNGIIFLDTPSQSCNSDFVFSEDRRRAKLTYEQLDENKMKILARYKIGEYEEGGTFCISDDLYFVHAISPTLKGVPELRKALVFIIDVSGSMEGVKLEQTKSAFVSMIQELKEDDLFGIITFSTDIKTWKPSLVAASSETKENAIDFVNNLEAEEVTNLNDAILEGIDLLRQSEFNNEKYAASIILLSDGLANEGVYDPEDIIENVIDASTTSSIDFSVFTLGFGFDVDYNLMRDLALRNNGIERRIYEDKDAIEQMTGFFDEIKSVILKNVSMRYYLHSHHYEIEDVTKNQFYSLFEGTEILVAGKLKKKSSKSKQTRKEESNDDVFGTNDPLVFDINFSAQSSKGKVNESIHKEIVLDRSTTTTTTTKQKRKCEVEMTYVLMRIRELMIDYFLTTNPLSREKALNLSLQHSLVTEVTSIFVEKDDEFSALKEHEQHGYYEKQENWGSYGTGILLMDVTPLSLGWKDSDGLMNTVIPRNSKIPTRREKIVRFKDIGDEVDHQNGEVTRLLSIWEGERVQVSDNVHLQDMYVSVSKPEIDNYVEIVFEITVNGELEVNVFLLDEDGTTKLREIGSVMMTHSKLTNDFDEIEAILEEAEKMMQVDELIKKKFGRV